MHERQFLKIACYPQCPGCEQYTFANNVGFCNANVRITKNGICKSYAPVVGTPNEEPKDSMKP